MVPILVTGGTGVLGREAVRLLGEAGRPVRVLTRKGGEDRPGVEHRVGDLRKGEGLAEALEGVQTVLHLAGGPKGDDVAAHKLATAARRAGVRHLLLISVIAADRMPIGYFRAKLGAEEAVRQSGVPWTTLRAAQFHSLALAVARSMSRMPVVPAPGGLRFQPVDPRDVAERLVELTLGEPAGLVRDLAGPETFPLADLARDILRREGRRRLFVPIRIPGVVGRKYRAGENLSLDADLGRRTWAAYLAGVR